MCGRYLFFDEQNTQMQRLISLVKEKLPKQAFEELSLFEVFPSQNVIAYVLDATTKEVGVKILNWGIPKTNGRIINARSETANTSLFFKDYYRVIIPACGYYEWDKEKNKYYFSTKEKTIYLAALAKQNTPKDQFVILTEEASEPELQIHPRQPILFSKEDAKEWLLGKTYDDSIKNSIHERIMSRVSR